MKKYFLTLCTLGLGMLATLWVCAQSETTTSEKTEKTPGEQLLEFILNPPEKFDFAGMQVMYLRGTPETNYFRLKCDEGLLFNAIGDEFIINNDSIDDLKHYGEVFSRYRDEYWDLKANQLTTWTNRHLKEEENNPIAEYYDFIRASTKSMISLYNITIENTPVLENDNLISYKNSQGDCIKKAVLTYNDQGYLVQSENIFTTPVKLAVKTNESYMIGNVTKYYYGTNNVPPFFPSELHEFAIIKTISNEEETFKTNKLNDYFNHHLNLSPSFNRSNFEIVPSKEDNLQYYWISGTNKVYVDDFSGTVKKVLSHDDINEYLANRKETQSKYRGIYIVLVIISFMVFFFLIMKKSKSK